MVVSAIKMRSVAIFRDAIHRQKQIDCGFQLNHNAIWFFL